MTTYEQYDEYGNDRTKLLSEEPESEPVRELHDETARFNYRHSDGDHRQEEIELCERRRSNDSNGELRINRQARTRVLSKPRLFSKIPKRFIILALMMLANFNMYCIRMCLNVTIVAMTHGNDGSQPNDTAPEQQGGTAEPEFHWDKQFQGTILASLYWGYTTLQIPAGLLTLKYEGSFLLGIAIFGSSVLTLATPFIVRQNVYAFMFLRVMEGAFLGLVGASGMSLVSKWAPVYERSIFLMITLSGLLWGTVIANSLSGLLADSSWGWPAVFYYFGVQGILWFLFWIYFAYEEPSDHPNITQAELDRIGKHWNTELSLRDIPWRYILTSIRVWAIIVPNFTECWGFYTFMLSFPTYLKDVQNLHIATIGFASSLPYISSAILSPVWGYFVDFLRGRKYLSTTKARKLSTLVGSGIGSAFFGGLVYTSSVTSAIVVATIATTVANFSASGAAANIVELAPKYSGVLMGIANFSCNITGFISPEVVGAITGHGDIRHQWAIVFYLAAGINVVGMLFYLCFGSAEKQAWADY